MSCRSTRQERGKRRRARAGGAAEALQPEQVLDRLKDRVLIDGLAEYRAASSRRARDDRRDVAAGGEPTATVVARALVPGQEQQPARTERPQQRRNEPG